MNNIISADQMLLVFIFGEKGTPYRKTTFVDQRHDKQIIHFSTIYLFINLKGKQNSLFIGAENAADAMVQKQTFHTPKSTYRSWQICAMVSPVVLVCS